MGERSIPIGTVAITGHRDFGDTAGLYRGLDQNQANSYMLCGARGVDEKALQYLAETQPRSTRIVVVPNRVIDQPATARAAIGKYSTQVIELKNKGYDRYQVRNRFMVDNSTRVKAFYDLRGSGGTLNTIRYAQSKGKFVEVIYLKPLNIRDIMRKSPKEFVDWMRSGRALKVPLRMFKGIILEYAHGLASRGALADYEMMLIEMEQYRSMVGE